VFTSSIILLYVHKYLRTCTGRHGRLNARGCYYKLVSQSESDSGRIIIIIYIIYLYRYYMRVSYINYNIYSLQFVNLLTCVPVPAYLNNIFSTVILSCIYVVVVVRSAGKGGFPG